MLPSNIVTIRCKLSIDGKSIIGGVTVLVGLYVWCEVAVRQFLKGKKAEIEAGTHVIFLCLYSTKIPLNCQMYSIPKPECIYF